MREIKFRAWHKKRKVWIDFLLVSIASMGSEFFEFEHWRQFTGLKDYENQDIYEDDIVRLDTIEDGDVIKLVEFIGTGWEPFVQNMMSWHDAERFRIIGNVYENPDILSPASEVGG